MTTGSPWDLWDLWEKCLSTVQWVTVETGGRGGVIVCEWGGGGKEAVGVVSIFSSRRLTPHISVPLSHQTACITLHCRILPLDGNLLMHNTHLSLSSIIKKKPNWLTCASVVSLLNQNHNTGCFKKGARGRAFVHYEPQNRSGVRSGSSSWQQTYMLSPPEGTSSTCCWGQRPSYVFSPLTLPGHTNYHNIKMD